jgi:pimeloyl-ACP methyl ester carboxylesterase
MEKNTPLDFDKPHDFLDLQHSRLAYWRTGSGPDLFFVHGWPLRAATFRHIAAALADSYTCHLVDLPGTGATVIGPDTPIGLGAHAETVRAAVDKLGLRSYAMVAHDSGGFIARAVAAADKRVSALVLGNTEIPRHTPTLLAIYVMLGRLGLGAAITRRMLASPRLRRSSLVFGDCFRDPAFVDGEFCELFVDPLVQSRAALDGQLRLLQGIDSATIARLTDIHHRITAPTTLIWGTDDPWFPLPKARAMLAELGGPARLVEIRGAKLFAHEDHGAEFVAHTRAALADARLSARAGGLAPSV